MDLSDLISPQAVVPSLKVNSKKQALQELAAKAATVTGLPERDIFDTLLQRERLGSTGVGNGIAIPHGKLVALDRLVGLFARLDRPIDFDALDDQPVDLVFVLLAPEGRVPITSRRWPGSRGGCATPAPWRSSGQATTRRRSTRS